MFLKELLVTHSSDCCWSAVFRCEKCYWLCEDQDHRFLNFLCCLFWVFCFIFVWFFPQNKLIEISVLMDVTGGHGLPGYWILEVTAVHFCSVINFFWNSLYNIEIKILFISSLTFQSFTTSAFKTMIYNSKMETRFCSDLLGVIFIFAFVKLLFRTDQNLFIAFLKNLNFLDDVLNFYFQLYFPELHLHYLLGLTAAILAYMLCFPFFPLALTWSQYVHGTNPNSGAKRCFQGFWCRHSCHDFLLWPCPYKLITILCVSYVLTSVHCCKILGTPHSGNEIFSERKMKVQMLLHQISLVFYWILFLCQGKFLKKWTWFWSIV